MGAPIPSKLDQTQILQGVYDEQTGRLRVLADLETVITNPPTIETAPNRFSINDFSQYITTKSTEILGMNPIRNYLYIQNFSKNKVWLDFNVPALQGFPSMQLNSGQILFMESTSITVDSIFAIGEIDNIPLIIKEG